MAPILSKVIQSFGIGSSLDRKRRLGGSGPPVVSSITFHQSADNSNNFFILLYAFRVNGSIVELSTAEANAQVTFGGGATLQDGSKANVFDNDEATRLAVGPVSSATKTVTWTPATPLNADDTIEIYTQTEGGAGGILAVSVNDASPLNFSTTSTSLGYYDIEQSRFL